MDLTHATAGDVMKALKTRHSEDIFIPECKDGSTYAGSHFRMDAWAMKRSWADPIAWGYEVKVSRSDFLRDEKWRNYLPLCNRFSFVCPNGVIDPGEVADGVGLMYLNGGGKLITKRKAAHRTVAIPEDLYRYILMSRVRIKDEEADRPPHDPVKYWTDWLENESMQRYTGMCVAKRMRERHDAALARANTAELRSENYEAIREFCRTLGVDPDVPGCQWKVQQALRREMEIVPAYFRNTMSRAYEALASVMNVVDELEGRKKKEEPIAQTNLIEA